MAQRDEEFVDLMRAVYRGVFDRMRELMRERGIPGISMALLRLVQKHPGLTLSDAARELEIAKSHLSNAVESLSHVDLIEKRPDPKDHRLLRLHPTPAANELTRDLREGINRRLGALLQTLPESDVECLLRVLRTLDATLRNESSTHASANNL